MRRSEHAPLSHVDVLTEELSLQRREEIEDGIGHGKNPKAQPHDSDEPWNGIAAVMMKSMLRLRGVLRSGCLGL